MEWEEMGDRGSAPSPFIAEEGQPAPPTITGNDDFPCMSQGFVKSCSCRGSVGKRRRPRPINRHASTEAAGFWGPRCSVLDPWLRREAKPERTLGPGATVGVLGTGVPRLACLRPAAWLKGGGGNTAHLHQHRPKTLARGQASRGGRHRASLGTASPGWLARRRRDQGGVPHEVPVTQAMTTKGASPRSVLLSSLVQRGQAQPRSTEASGKGCHFGATRPRPGGLPDGGHCGAQDGVTTRALCRRRLLLSG